MNEDSLQSLATINKPLDSALPAALKKVADSPEMKRIVEISQKAQETIPIVLTRFVEATAPYMQAMNDTAIKIAPYLLKFAEVSARLNVVFRLGKVEYVAWRNFPEEFYEQAYQTGTNEGLLICVYDWLKENQFMDVDETLEKLNKNESLKDNLVLAQSVGAYRRGDYDLASLGFTALVDRLLSEYSGITGTNIMRRVEEISKKIEVNGEGSLDEAELNDYILFCTYADALQIFGEARKFDEAEPDLNRHWLMHGRINRRMEQIDCIRIINILYGTTLMDRMGKVSGA